MNSIKIFVTATVLSLSTFGAFAQSVTATASTLADAEAKVATLAKASDASYKITGARVNNGAYVTAELIK